MDWNERYFSELGHSPEVTALVKAKAEEGAAIARATAPVKTGAYRDSIHVEVVSWPSRNAALIVASDPKSLLIESETGNLVRALNRVAGG
jgi:hypothetical protein